MLIAYEKIAELRMAPCSVVHYHFCFIDYAGKGFS